MNPELLNTLLSLKENPLTSSIDHIMILHDLYFEYRNGNELLKPIATYFINGLDDLPALSEKHLWNDEKFNEFREPLYDSHSELILLLEELIKSAKR